MGLDPLVLQDPHPSEHAGSAPEHRERAQRARGQRWIIPARSFDEPNCETVRNVWWRFRRADGNPWGVAGLWNVWTDKATREVVESYTMLTMNADAHPLMRRMHKPDPKLQANQQDKRSLVLLESADFDQWLTGTVEEAQQLVRLTPIDAFDAAPANEATGNLLDARSVASVAGHPMATAAVRRSDP